MRHPTDQDNTYHGLCYTSSSVVRAFAHGATMGRRIDPSWGGPIELFLVPASDPRLVCVTKAVVCAIISVGWCNKRTFAANRKE